MGCAVEKGFMKEGTCKFRLVSSQPYAASIPRKGGGGVHSIHCSLVMMLYTVTLRMHRFIERFTNLW